MPSSFADRPTLNFAFDFVERCAAFQSTDKVLSELKTAVAKLGFDSFIMTGLPLPDRPLEPLILLNAWPSGWFERYVHQGYFHDDPVGQFTRVSDEPFLWSDVPGQLLDASANARKVMNEATEFGLSDGYCIPVYSGRRWQSAIALAASRPVERDARMLAAAHMIAVYAYGRVRKLLDATSPPPLRLTPREREVLIWTAAGKSAWDVSVILGIAERTVHAHLENIRRKLDVLNTTQAVVAALHAGEIDPF